MKRQRLMFVSTTRATLAALMALVVFTAQTPVAAADTDLAQGADTDKVYMVLSAKFKPGKAQEALKMIREHFLKVDKAVGRRVIPFDQTGEWDHVVYFPYDPVRGTRFLRWPSG